MQASGIVNPAAPAEEAPPSSGDQDLLFRIQMALSDFMLGNAKYAGVLLGVVLVGALVYGLASSYLSTREASEFAAIARIDFKMPKVEDLAKFGLAPMDDKTDTARMSDVEEGARRYEATGDTSHGAAAVYAYLKSADAWQRVDKKDQMLAVLAKASKVGAKDLAGFTADSAYAHALLDAGKTDEALGVYRDMAERYKGFYGERSLLLLADAQIGAGKMADAKTAIDQFKQRYSDSPRASDVTALEQLVGSGG